MIAKITVEKEDGSKKCLSGEKLEKFLENIRDAIIFAQQNGYVTDAWKEDDWDEE